MKSDREPPGLHVAVLGLDPGLERVLAPAAGGEVALERLGAGVAPEEDREVSVGREVGIVLAPDHRVPGPVVRALRVVLPRLLAPDRIARVEAEGRHPRRPHRLVRELVRPHRGDLPVGVVERREVIRHVHGLVGAVHLDPRPRAVDLSRRIHGGVVTHLHEPLPAPHVMVRSVEGPVLDGLQRDLVARVEPVGELEVRVDLVPLSVAELHEVEQRGARPGERGAQVGVAEAAFVGREVGEVLERRRTAEAEGDAIEVVEGLGRVAVAVGVPPHLAAETVGAFPGAHVHDAGQRVAVFGVEPAREDIGAGDRQRRDRGPAPEQRIRHLHAAELELHLAAAPAAEVQLAPLRHHPGFGAHRLAQVVDRDLPQLLGADILHGLRGLGVDALLGAHLDLLDLFHDLGLAEVERDRRGRAGVHLHRLHLLVEAQRLHLDLRRADRHAGENEIAVRVRHRAQLGAEDDDVGELDRRLATLENGPAHAARRRGLRRRRRGREQRERRKAPPQESEPSCAMHGTAPLARATVGHHAIRNHATMPIHSVTVNGFRVQTLRRTGDGACESDRGEPAGREVRETARGPQPTSEAAPQRKNIGANRPVVTNIGR